MSWVERTARRDAYVQRKEITPEEHTIRYALEENKRNLIANEIFVRLRVEDAFTDVQREVWKEGEIDKKINGSERSLRLTSEPFKIIRVVYDESWRKKDSDLALTLSTSRLALQLNIDFSFTGKKPRLEMVDNGEGSAIALEVLQGREGIEQLVRQKGWKSASRRIFSRQHSDYHREPIVIEDLSEGEQPDKFNKELVGIVELRKKRGKLPSELRADWQSVIHQFPASLQEKGVLTVGELKRWERKLRGPNILQRRGLLFPRKPSQPTKV